MKPTAKLRFFERELTFPTGQITIPDGFPVIGRQTFRTLQQWWEDPNIILTVHITDADGNTLPSPYKGEWRDIPLVKEEE